MCFGDEAKRALQLPNLRQLSDELVLGCAPRLVRWIDGSEVPFVLIRDFAAVALLGEGHECEGTEKNKSNC